MPADLPNLPKPVETTAGRCVLRLGDPAGAKIVGEHRRGDTRSLVQAIAQERAERRIPVKGAARKLASVRRAGVLATPADMQERETTAVEHGGKRVDEVTDKIAQALELVGELVIGRVDVSKLAPVADELLSLLGRLNRDGRWEEAVRVARCLAIVLALLSRWAELLDSLRTAEKAAEQIEDTGGRAWALHERGTLRLAGEDYAGADNLLGAAHGLRKDAGDTHGANVTAGNMQALCGALRARLHEPPVQRLVRILNKPVPTFVLGALLLIGGGAAGAFIRGRGEKPHPAALVEKVKVDIQLTPSPPRANERAEFTATVKPGAAARYEWRFGDGEKSSAVAPKHVYRHPGTYTAKLIVRGPHREFVGEGLLAVHVGPESSRRRSPPRRPPRSRSSAYVPLEPSPPIASFRFTPSSPVIGQVVVFDAASSSEPDRRASITSYAWKFGDGTTGTGRMPSHRYEKPGTYTAELVIADTREASASATREVVVKSTTPSAPSDVVASAGDSSAEVRWAAPEDGGSAISAYVVRPYAEGKQEPAVEVPTGTHAAIGGLTNGTTYTFTVTAVSSVGRGPASKHSNAVTPTAQVPTVKINPPAITKPAAPTSVAAIPGEDSATVTWTSPPNGGSVITSYTITPYVGDEARPAENVSGAITGAEVGGLTSGISYTFTVSATNAGGQGPPSAHSNAVTPTSPPLPPRPTVPSAPTGVSASAGEASATVTWAAPASGNSAITSYTVTPYAGEEAKAPIDVTSGTSTTVRGLVNGTTYTFTVSAVNSVGTGPPSERSPAVTPVGVPAAPTGVVATSGREGVALSWVVPADEGSPITSYTITIIPYAEGEPQTPTSERSVSGAGGEATIPPTELTPEQRYAFTVAAVNAVGKGPASTLSNVVTAEGSEP